MKQRLLSIFFRLLSNEQINKEQLSKEYNVSIKTISRDLTEIKNFLADDLDLTNGLELTYNKNNNTHSLNNNKLLLPKELLVIIKILIESRAIERTEFIRIIDKIKGFTNSNNKDLLQEIISKEIMTYSGVKHMNVELINLIWNISDNIYKRKEISIDYYKIDGKKVKRHILPIAIVFSEYYFYLIAYRSDKDDYKPLYYRVDRITNVIVHRKNFDIPKEYYFDEGELKEKIHFMTYGELRKIKFEFTGLSVQAILDKIPTAKVIENDGKKSIIVADAYGDGIKYFLLSQGSWIKVLEPESFVREMREELEKMCENYKLKGE